MKRDTLGLALYLIVLGFGSHVQCYETDTHGDMSYHAFDRSVLAQPSTLERLGLSRYAVEQPFHLPDDAAPYAPERDAYFDYAPLTWVNNTISELYRRPVTQYERNQFPGLGPTPFRKSKSNELRLKAWLMRGAVREDDLRQTDYEPPEIPPDIDPYGEQVRVFHHFYDPIFDRPLTLPLGASCTVIPGSIDAGCVKTTDWALGVSNAAGTTPSGPDLARRNHSSYVDAREAEWCGLTYKVTNTVNASVSHAGARRACWATSIKALGHVLHLLQDLAQPQHVRNDRHNPTSAKWWTNPFATSQARRTYEIWTNYRSTRAEISSPEGEEKAFRGFFEAQATVPATVTGSYPKPMFSKPIEFFTTRATDISINERRGLADFTNRNFYSEGSTYSIEYTSPPSLSSDAGLTFVNRPGDTVPTFGQLIYRDVLWTAIDSVQPAYVDAPLAVFGGKIPLTTESIWQADTFFERSTVISLEQYSAHADVLIPRAIAYSAGLIDYFFRGKLEITPNAQQVFAVLNQGEPHTVNALGNPFRPNDKVFGFEKIRLRVRNVTDAITESGSSSAAIPQTSSNGKMVAVARYHRNACYKPDMSGERMRGYAPPPTLGAITEPTCSAALPSRTNYEEISVSAEIDINSSADLPGGEGTGGSAVPVDQVFDFTDDPIPVNATDLFIQVVYRGQLGEEPDGIAVGNYDVREPTFIGIVNNTDYFWSSSVPPWRPANPLFPLKNMDAVRVCAGAATDTRWAYYGVVDNGFPPLGFPAPNPGVIRLAMIFPKPSTATQRFSVRVTPVVTDGFASPPQRGYFTSGQQRQANQERITAAVLNDPQMCTPTLPTAASFWCNEPIKKRRGIPLGEIAAFVHYQNNADLIGGDVDAQPVPAFPNQDLTTTGIVKFNEEMLSPCPAAPPSSVDAQALIEFMEMAAYEGTDVST